MEGPVLLPETAVEIPAEGVAVQPVAPVPVLQRQARFEIERRVLVVQRPGRRGQRREYRPVDRLAQQIRLPGQVQGEPGLGKGGPERALVEPRVAEAQGDIPAPAAPGQQLLDPQGRAPAFVLHGLIGGQGNGIGLEGTGGSGEEAVQQGLDPGVPGFPGRHPVHGHRNAPLRRQQAQAPGGLPHRTGDGRLGVAGGQGHGQAPAPAQQRLQHPEFRPGEVGEAVHPDPVGGGPVRFHQPVGQNRQLFGRVRRPLGRHRQIALVEQGQLRQLLGKLPLRPARRLQQSRGSQTVALKFLGHLHQIREELRPPQHRRIEMDFGGGLFRGQSHGQQPSALVEIGPSRAAVGGGHPVPQPREAQHLGIAADAVAAHLAEGPLGLVGELLRHQKDLPRLRGRLPHQLVRQMPRQRRPIRARTQCQHIRPRFRW